MVYQNCQVSEYDVFNFYSNLSSHIKLKMLIGYPNNCVDELLTMALALEELAKEMRLTASMRQFCAEEFGL